MIAKSGGAVAAPPGRFGTASRWLVVLPAMVLLGAIVVAAVRMGRSDLVAEAAAREMASWPQKNALPTPDDWSGLRARLALASAISPADPAIPELLGLLDLSRPDTASAREAYRELLHSLSLRPSSPYTWANVAEARRRLGFSNSDVLAAILIALQLGPAEPEVQRTLIDIGLAQWDRLPEPMRQELRKALAQSMERYPFKTLPIVSRHGHLEMACPYVAGDARLARTSWPRRCQLQPPK